MKQKAFTLIEIITCIAIIIILMGLSSGIYRKTKNKLSAVKTAQTFSILTQALQIYKNMSGSFPLINNIQNQSKLYEALSTRNWEIKNFKGEVVDYITDKPCLSILDLQEDKSLKKEGTSYFFYDGWGNKISYYYGPIDEADPYAASYAYTSETGIKYNQNWRWKNFDLFSSGEDKKTGNDESRKDDMTNFK